MELAAIRLRVVNFMGQLICSRFLAALGLLLSVYLYVASLMGVTPTNDCLIWGLARGDICGVVSNDCSCESNAAKRTAEGSVENCAVRLS
jgi:hypothetical protein